MLKNNTFSASILEGFGLRFGRVFGRFFRPKIHAESNLKKSVRQAKSIVKTNKKSMSALLQQSMFRAKIDEKSHVFWDIDFGWILGGFWEGFGKPKSLIFALFSMFFRSIFLTIFLKAKKSQKRALQDRRALILGRACGMSGLRGREEERGGRPRMKDF